MSRLDKHLTSPRSETWCSGRFKDKPMLSSSRPNSKIARGLVAAEQAYREAEYERALWAIEGDDSPRATCLSARALNRLDRFGESLAKVQRNSRSCSQSVLLAELGTLEGSSLTHLGQTDEARKVLNRAILISESANHLELQLESRYKLGVLEFAVRDYESGLKQFQESLKLYDDFLGPKHPSYFNSAEELKANHLNGVYCAYGFLTDYVRMAEVAFEAAKVQDLSPLRDPFNAMMIPINLSSLIRDIDFAGVAPESVLERWNQLPRSKHVQVHLPGVLRNLALAKAVRGDNLGARRWLKIATNLPSPPEVRLCISSEAARLSHALGERERAEQELNVALEYASRVDWNSTTGDSRIALVRLAQITAEARPRVASVLLNRFKNIGTNMSLLQGARHDPRCSIEVTMAEALIAKGEGRAGEAIRLMTTCFDFWDSTKVFKRQAVEVALQLAELTGQDRLFAFADKWLEGRPKSYLSSRATRAKRLNRNELRLV